MDDYSVKRGHKLCYGDRETPKEVLPSDRLTASQWSSTLRFSVQEARVKSRCVEVCG